jgi:hypothetical protein
VITCRVLVSLARPPRIAWGIGREVEVVFDNVLEVVAAEAKGRGRYSEQGKQCRREGTPPIVLQGQGARLGTLGHAEIVYTDGERAEFYAQILVGKISIISQNRIA